MERCIGWMEDRRRLVARFEGLAENFLAMVKPAMLERLLKALSPDTAQACYVDRPNPITHDATTTAAAHKVDCMAPTRETPAGLGLERASTRAAPGS